MAKYSTESIRNIAVLGHGGSGKTSLTETLLFDTGAINRIGRVEDGTTTSDWDAEEQRRGISINLSVLPVEFENIKLNFIDTPGYLDFVGEVVSALKVSEAALVLVDAVAGVEVGTELAWDRLDELNKPRIVFVNKMDRENANFSRVLENLRSSFPESTILPFYWPVGQGEEFKGVVSLVEMKAYIGTKSTPADVPDDLLDILETARLEQIEAAAETDDELIMKYLDGAELTPEEVRHGLHQGVLTGAIVPVFCGSVSANIGLTNLIRSLGRYVPMPQDRHVAAMDGENALRLDCDPNGPLVGWVFKTIIDRYVGRMTYVRIFSGCLNKDARIVNQRTGTQERVANLFSVQGKELEPTDQLVAGDIGVITKMEDFLTRDSLTAPDHHLQIVQPPYPKPLFSVAVAPATKADSAKMGHALHAIIEEDPTLNVENVSATRQTVLQGMGETHVDVAVRSLESKFGTKVETSVPKVTYQETITRLGQAQYRHKKQTGGAGQFAEVYLRVEPQDRGVGFEYVSEVFGGAISHTFLPSIEKGIRQVMDQGVLAGYPVVDVKAVVFDGKEHPVDSKDIAFQVAGREVFKLAMLDGGATLLEPIYEIEIIVPDEYMGDVMGDLNTRRGRVAGIEQRGKRSVIQAQVPLAEIMRYGTDLRSMTQGRGIYAIEFNHYEPIPSHLLADVIAASKQEHEEES